MNNLKTGILLTLLTVLLVFAGHALGGAQGAMIAFFFALLFAIVTVVWIPCINLVNFLVGKILADYSTFGCAIALQKRGMCTLLFHVGISAHFCKS